MKVPPMPMRMWTERNQGEDDPYGNPSDDWQPQLSDEPCYWWVDTGTESASESRQVTVAAEHAIATHGIDITEGDRIVQVIDQYGRTVFTNTDPFREVEHVGHFRSFYDATLKLAG